MKLSLLILITLITATTYCWGEEDYIIWKYNNNSPIENAYFGGDNDEFIYIVGQYTLYKMSTQDNEILDTINYPRGSVSNAISHLRNEVYVSVKDSIIAYKLSNFKENRKVINIPLTGRVDPKDILTFYSDIKLSSDNRFLTCVYQENNGTTFERLNQIIIYDLDNDIIVKRFDHNKSNSNLIDFKISYENPTFIEQDSKIIFSSKTSSKDSLLSQVFILDYNSDKLDEVIEARNKIGNSDFFQLNNDLINISQSSLPYTKSFNVLDLRNNKVFIYHDFEPYSGDFRPMYPYVISNELVLISLNDHFQDIPCFTFLDLESKLISKFFYNIPHRGVYIDFNNTLDKFLSHSRSEIYLHDLTKYLAETNVEDNKNTETAISPNPTNGVVHFSLDCTEPELAYSIYSSVGAVLASDIKVKQGRDVSIDFSAYPTGVYFVSFLCNGELKTYKIIKEG